MGTTVLSAIVSTLCGAMAAQLLPRPSDSNRGQIHQSIPDQVAVQHGIGANNAAMERTFSAHGAILHAHHPPLGISVLRVDPSRRDPVLKALGEAGLLDFVELRYIAHVEMTPNHPRFRLRWHLANLKVPRASHVTNAAVPIAIVDSGVESTPSDPASNLVKDWHFLSRHYV